MENYKTPGQSLIVTGANNKFHPRDIPFVSSAPLPKYPTKLSLLCSIKKTRRQISVANQ